MKKIDWKAELKKLTTSKGSDSLKMEITPYRDWRIVIVVSFIGLVVSLVYNIFVLVQINRDSFFVGAPKTAGVLKFNEEGLAKVVAGLDEKIARFEKVKTEGVAVVDPSI